MNQASLRIYKFLATIIFSCLIISIYNFDSYISVSRHCNLNKINKQNENRANEPETQAHSKESNSTGGFLNQLLDILMTINLKENFYYVELFFSNKETKKKFTAQMPVTSKGFHIPDLNAVVEFQENYTKENLMMNIKIGGQACSYHLKRVFWGKQEQYDFTIEIRDRKEAFEYGIFVHYKNKEEFLNKVLNHISILILEGEKKCGKTFLCSKLANNTSIMLDYSLNTEGITGIFERNLLFVDSEGLGTEKSNNLFNNTFHQFNSDLNIKKNEKISSDPMDDYNENQRNILFQTYLRDAVRKLGNFYILVQNQINLNSLKHLEEVIDKFVSDENSKDLRVLVIYNYKDINEVSKIKRRIHTDIISRHKVQPIETYQKFNDQVYAYDDLYYRLKGGNTKIRVTYLVLGASGKESGNYFNDETLGYITSQAKNVLNSQFFNPIQRMVENLNEMILDHINPGTLHGKEYGEDEVSQLKCVELENFGDDQRLKNLERIAFSEHPLCRAVWEANVKNAQKLLYEVYIMHSILHLEIYLPFVKTLNEVELSNMDFSNNNFGNGWKIFVRGNVHLKNEASLLLEKIEFIKQRRIKHFVIDEFIKLPFSLKKKRVVNTCDFSLNHGMLKIKCPIIE